MTGCEQCGLQYDPSRGDCPGCAARARSRRGLAIGIAAAVILVPAICGLMTLGILSVGASASRNAADDARANACFAYQRMVEGAALMHAADRGVLPADIGSLVPAYLQESPECPGGGSYSLGVADDSPVCTCDVHGHYSSAGQ